MVIVLDGYFALLYFIFVIILYLFLSFFFGCPAWLVESQNLDQGLNLGARGSLPSRQASG